MFLNKFLQLMFGGLFAATAPTPAYAPASVEELLSYECAKNVADMIANGEKLGPVFHEDGLIFTSILNANGDKVLLVNAGTGTFSLLLPGVSVSRIRFTLPKNGGGELQAFYMSYVHGERMRSRFSEFSTDKAITGRDEMDYQDTPVRRSDALLTHMEYAIFQTSENIMSALTQKKLTGSDLGLFNNDSCDHIGRRSPSLARNLRFSLDVITSVILGPQRNSGGRMPASVSSSVPTGN